MPPVPRGRGRGRGGRSRGGYGGVDFNRPQYSPVALGSSSPMHIDEPADSPPASARFRNTAITNGDVNLRRDNDRNIAVGAARSTVDNNHQPATRGTNNHYEATSNGRPFDARAMPNAHTIVENAGIASANVVRMPNGRNVDVIPMNRHIPERPPCAVDYPAERFDEPRQDIPARNSPLSGGGGAAEDAWEKSLAQWGIPPKVVQIYREAKIVNFFRWQYDCLLRNDVLDGKNFVYSAPTSAGKTLVAEVLLLKRVCEDRCKGMIVLPYISVATEKLYSLRKRFASAGIKVDGYIGSSNANWDRTQVAVCTFEKANALVNRLVEERRMDELGIIVVDELHMIGDKGRGYLLELLLTKLRFLSEKSVKQLQIIGMSATLPNLPTIARWLGAESYVTDFRPVPLTEYVRLGDSLYNRNLEFVRKIDVPVGLPK